MVFRVSPKALIPTWWFFIRKARNREDCSAGCQPPLVYLRHPQGNTCPRSLLFAQARTLLQYPVLRESIAFSHHLPADGWRTLGSSEGRSCVLWAWHTRSSFSSLYSAAISHQLPAAQWLLRVPFPLRLQSWSVSWWPLLFLWIMPPALTDPLAGKSTTSALGLAKMDRLPGFLFACGGNKYHYSPTQTQCHILSAN